MIINNDKKLNIFTKIFSKKNFICIDTEFERKNTYFSKLSIISISDGKKYFIFDILKNPKYLEILKKLLKKKSLLKIMHGSLQDIEIFNKFDISVDPFFDTQIANGFVGLDKNISYANLVKKYLNKTLDKKYQNHDWLKRPISKPQINYLKNDVLHLHKIFLKQKKILIREKKLSYAKEEFKLFKKKIMENNGINTKFKKRLDIKIYKNKNFLKLLRIRDNIGQRNNLPKNWVLKDEEIIQFIKKGNETSVKRNKYFSNTEKRTFITLIKPLKKIKIPKKKDELEIKTLEFFRFLISNKYSIDGSLIASKYDLEDFRSKKLFSKWRNQIFYNVVGNIMLGKKKFRLKDFDQKFR